MREVVEEESRGRDRPQRVGRRRLPRHELRVADLVDERDKGQEPAGDVLLGAEPEQVVDALGLRLDVTVQHGRVGGEPEGMRDAVDFAPPVRIGLARVGEGPGDALGEDLRAPARHRVKAGRLQAGQRLLGLDLPPPPEIIDLGRRERLDLHLGPPDVHRLDHPLEVLEGPVGMVAADDVHLAHAVPDHPEDVLDRVLEGAGLAGLSGEVAELAREHADVRRVDVAVDDEVDAGAVPPRLHVVREPAEPEQVIRLEEEHSVVAGETLVRSHLVPDRGQPGIDEAHGASLGGMSHSDGSVSNGKYPRRRLSRIARRRARRYAAGPKPIAV